MKFDRLVTLLEEDQPKQMAVLFVEDLPMRHTLIKAYMQKYLPKAIYHIVTNRYDAAQQIHHYYNVITHYSLDFNLENGETSEAIARMLAKMGHDGTNIYIHSDDDNGQQLIKSILPNAQIVSIPKNITMMAGV